MRLDRLAMLADEKPTAVAQHLPILNSHGEHTIHVLHHTVLTSHLLSLSCLCHTDVCRLGSVDIITVSLSTMYTSALIHIPHTRRLCMLTQALRLQKALAPPLCVSSITAVLLSV